MLLLITILVLGSVQQTHTGHVKCQEHAPMKQQASYSAYYNNRVAGYSQFTGNGVLFKLLVPLLRLLHYVRPGPINVEP